MNDDQFHNKIIEQIQSGKVTMHSRAYWTWKTVLMGLGLALVAVAGIFIASFIIFILHANGVWDLPKFGAHGLHEFLLYFPWLFVPAIILFIWLLERFVLQYSFGYRIPVLYSALIIVIVIVVGSIVVSTTPLHQRLYESAEAGHVPGAEGIYNFFNGNHPDDFYVGRISAATGPLYTLTMPNQKGIECLTDSNTSFHNSQPIKIGDFVEVIGEENKGVVDTFDIRKINPGNPFPLRPPPQ